jgi:beta-aspartyl-peptidase (threonine type)
MSETARPPLVRLKWRHVFAFLILDAILTAAVIAYFVNLAYGAPATTESTVRAVLDAQENAWNRGDLVDFMTGYWKDDRLTFFSGDTITSGWQKTYDRYQQRYRADGKEMGRLSFSDIQIEPLGDTAAFVRGRWKLTMKDGKTPNGLFTLFFRRIDGNWRIVHDHTSVAESK